MNQKNSLGLNNCFLDLDDPIELFKVWMDEAKKSEPNDPNALSLATSSGNNLPSVRMVLYFTQTLIAKRALILKKILMPHYVFIGKVF